MIFDIATADDADAIAKLVNAAYRGIGDAAGWTNETALLSGIRTDAAGVASLIDDAPTTTILLTRAAQTCSLLGCVAVDVDGEACTISMLAIHPSLQAGGHGKALLAAAETFAAANGARVATMTVIRQRDALLAWYERRGYRLTGEIEPFPYGDDSVGTPLRDDLQFAVLAKPLGTGQP